MLVTIPSDSIHGGCMKKCNCCTLSTHPFPTFFSHVLIFFTLPSGIFFIHWKSCCPTHPSFVRRRLLLFVVPWQPRVRYYCYCYYNFVVVVGGVNGLHFHEKVPPPPWLFHNVSTNFFLTLSLSLSLQTSNPLTHNNN